MQNNSSPHRYYLSIIISISEFFYHFCQRPYSALMAVFIEFKLDARLPALPAAGYKLDGLHMSILGGGLRTPSAFIRVAYFFLPVFAVNKRFLMAIACEYGERMNVRNGVYLRFYAYLTGKDIELKLQENHSTQRRAYF